jgi:hypothetical protein
MQDWPGPTEEEKMRQLIFLCHAEFSQEKDAETYNIIAADEDPSQSKGFR